MGRRQFTLQLYDGKVLSPPMVPTSGTRIQVAVVPVWRCSGCLMAWSTYGCATILGRPMGSGCGSCAEGRWFGDNVLARRIDVGNSAYRVDGGAMISKLHEAAPVASAALEYAIAEGGWRRLTLSCESFIGKRVRECIDQVMHAWVVQNESCKQMRPLNITFQYPSAGSRREISVTIILAKPGETTPESKDRFIVRYRWVQ